MFDFVARVWLTLGTLGAALVFSTLAPAAETTPEVHVIAYGLFGDQDVFEKEARQAAGIVARRYGAKDVVVRFNSKTAGPATSESLRADIQAVASRFKTKQDVLILLLTSHGSQVGVRVKAGPVTEAISGAELRDMLNGSGILNRIVVISACYSGVYVPALANPNTLAITAADADNTSFGCQAGNNWTFFGDAFFNRSLPRAASLQDAFNSARDLIYGWETARRLKHSNPQMAGGENVLADLERAKAPTGGVDAPATVGPVTAAPSAISDPAAYGCVLQAGPADGISGCNIYRGYSEGHLVGALHRNLATGGRTYVGTGGSCPASYSVGQLRAPDKVAVDGGAITLSADCKKGDLTSQ
jgi:hypothetical protein